MYVWGALAGPEYKILEYLQHKRSSVKITVGWEQLQTHSDETFNKGCMKSAPQSLQSRCSETQSGFDTR